jgi:hypothetical protein
VCYTWRHSPESAAITFKVWWTSKVGGWISFRSSCSAGFRIEREYAEVCKTSPPSHAQELENVHKEPYIHHKSPIKEPYITRKGLSLTPVHAGQPWEARPHALHFCAQLQPPRPAPPAPPAGGRRCFCSCPLAPGGAMPAAPGRESVPCVRRRRSGGTGRAARHRRQRGK